MKLVVAYDISDNARRLAVAKRLQRLGLTRVQRSFFVGVGGLEKIKEVIRAVRPLISWDTDCVIIMVVHEEAWRKAVTLGTPYGQGSVGEAEVVQA